MLPPAKTTLDEEARHFEYLDKQVLRAANILGSLTSCIDCELYYGTIFR
jgi:hypothetical protein